MTHIEEILSRALLVRDRAVPRDIVPPASNTSTEPFPPGDAPVQNRTSVAAAADLRALCETLVTHTPADDVADFVTEQLPQPRSAMILACVLQLTDTDDGARFWWQYAAGAGQAAAAYCLYLHHLALGEKDTANWWHQQTDEVNPPSSPDQPSQQTESEERTWHPAGKQVSHASTSTMLRILRHLAKYTPRPQSAVVTELMDYIPTAVAAGYLRQPEMDLPVPGPDFAHRVSALLEAAVDRPDPSGRLPARQPLRTRAAARAAARPSPREDATKPAQSMSSPMGETAAR
ncbi:hypothetical protein ACGF3K_33575 [Streptomyces sp. NPDC047980]|uniref:hypothetical protein n=1 Tax=Streptomyces sp. NPDC047980 TaxID=3365494 RepID=UPI0037210FB8